MNPVAIKEGILNDHDRNSATWEKVSLYCETRIAQLHRELEGDKDAVNTAKLRGRLAELRKFLRAGEPAREVVAGDESFTPC